MPWSFFIVYLESLSAMKQLSNDEKTKLVQLYWSSARLVQWKTHFHLTGLVNTQNCRVWASNAPDIVLEAPPLSPRVTVWCAMSSTGIIGPFFFKDADGLTQTVNKERYVDILKRFWVALQRGSPGADRLWFQQDGTTSHTASDPAVAGREVWDKAHRSRDGIRHGQHTFQT